MMDPSFCLSSLSRLLVGALSHAGVEDLVVSPGSRSTPYLAAALEAKRLRIHLVVDERSAAYVALGLARGRGRPVALLCTSGTAAANYLPAVVEARLTETPLVLLTADRPLSLQGCAAPQTIDQTRIFGNHVLGATSIGVPDGTYEEFLRIRRQILSSLAIGLGEPHGPVHFNLHTPKPLELVAARGEDERQCQARIDSLIASTRPITRPHSPRLDETAIQRLLVAVDRQSKGLIVSGFETDHAALDPLVLARFARATGFPILLDAAHPLRFDAPPELHPYLVAPFEPLLQIEQWRALQSPKLLIQIGRPLTSGAFERWMSNHGPGPSSPIEEVFLLARAGWPDPTGIAELLGHGDPSDALARVATHLESQGPRSSGWSARWFRAAGIVRDSIAAFAKIAAAQPADFGELRAVLAVLEAQPQHGRLIIGNSLPIREVDLVASPSKRRFTAEALRGASGIDGVVSTAIGFSLADDRPNTLLVGDISFLYDIGALWAARAVTAPLAIVVLNNAGGRIFEQLPVAQKVCSEALLHWTTPQALDLSGASLLYGIPHFRVHSANALASGLAEAHARPGATIIEAVVGPSSARAQKDDLVQAVRVALTRAGLLSEALGS